MIKFHVSLLCLFAAAMSIQSVSMKKRVTIVGSGNWGTVIAAMVAKNLDRLHEDYESELKMWVFEEEVNGRKLTEIINTEHENPKYLPGISLPRNVLACPDLLESCNDADVLVFVVPHQFLPGVLKQIKDNGRLPKHATGISLIKGLTITPEGPALLSDMIQKELDLEAVGVLMGANVANDVAHGDFVEATLACASDDQSAGKEMAKLFTGPSFRVQNSVDVAGVELCGALKNVVAMGAGFCDGMGLGSSTKAAVLRQGLQEMSLFCKTLAPETFQPTTILESCGVADVIATSYGGRNRKCSEEFIRRKKAGGGAGSDWASIEAALLGGMKMQGLGTLEEVMECMDCLNLDKSKFPLLCRIDDIARRGAEPETLFLWDH